jgi:hypothetical protein
VGAGFSEKIMLERKGGAGRRFEEKSSRFAAWSFEAENRLRRAMRSD